MKSYKIGFVLDDRLDKPDGVQQYVKQVGKWLSAQGHEVHYLVGESPSLKDSKVHGLSKTVGVKFNKNRMSIPLPANKKAIKKLLADEQFDVLHVQLPYSPLLAGRVISVAPDNVAIVGTFHILPYASLERAATKALSLILHRKNKRFDQIFSVSPAAQEFALKSFGVESTVLPNVVDIGRFSSAKKLSQFKGKTNIVFLGRLVERKGAQWLLKAYRELCTSNGFADANRLIICGDGQLRAKLEADAAELAKLNPKSEVIFTGFLSESAKANYLATADVAVFPSTGGESFGIVLIEAMAAGSRVVLAGNNPGYASVLNEIPEVLFAPKNTLEFSTLLAQASGDKRFINRVHAAQQELVKQYDVSVVGKKLLKYYTKLIATKAQKAHNLA